MTVSTCTADRDQTSGHDPRRSRWELVILGAMCVGYAGLMLCRNTLIASSAAMIRDPSVGLDKAAYGRLMSWHSAGAIAGKLATGVATDRIGGRRMFLLVLLLTAASTAAFGMVSGFYLFAVLNFSGQFFKSGAWPAVAKLIGEWYPRRKYGRHWSFIAISSRVGTMSAGVILGALLLVVSWRSVFMVSAAVAGLTLLAGWLWLKERPADVGLAPPQAERQASEEKGPSSHPLDGTTIAQACLAFARSPRVWLIFFGMAFLAILMDFIHFIPIYLSESLNLVPGEAAIIGSAFPAGMLVALIVASLFYDRFSRRQLVGVLGGLLALSCVCALTLWALPGLPIPDSMNLPIAIASIFMFGFATCPAYYLPMSIFSITFGGQHSGLLITLIDAFGYVAALLFNFFGGSIAQNYGWPVFLGGLLAVAFLALVTMTTFLRLEHTAEARAATARGAAARTRGGVLP
jgi:sugar phosphate permease